MEAAGSGEPTAVGQDGKQEASDDSDSGQVIIELDQSQIASPSDSEEEGQVSSPKKPEAVSDLPKDQSQVDSRSDSEEEGQVPESPKKPEAVRGLPKDQGQSAADESEYFDAVSDTDDIPDDEAIPEPVQSGEPMAEEPEKPDSPHDNAKHDIDKNEDCLTQGSETAADLAVSLEDGEVVSSTKHKEAGASFKAGAPSIADVDSGTDNSAVKDTVAPEKPPSKANRTEKEPPAEEGVLAESENSTPEQATAVSSEEKGPGEEIKGDSSLSAAGDDAPEGGLEAPPADKEASSKGKGPNDLFAIADDVSDVSSEGEAPLSPVEDEEGLSAEQLSKEAAHQAEALAPLGAEPVSEPESGEDMGSDESSPAHSPRYSSPAVVTSTSRISLGSIDYEGDSTRARATSRSPRKSDSAVISDSASSVQPGDRLDRLSLEDGVIPAGLSASDSKLDLSASMDMENISDDENIGEDNDSDEDTSGEIVDEPEEEEEQRPKVDETVSSTQQVEEEGKKQSSGTVAEKNGGGTEAGGAGERGGSSVSPRRPIMIASLGDKQQVQTHFGEEQVELDYEDVDGEGEVEEAEVPKPEEEDDGKEEGEDSDKDEGEIDDDDDCEEGEIKEPGGAKKPFVKPVCRFFQRGTCTWGLNCRFLHPGINDKGNYQMIELPGQRWSGPGGMGGPPWGGPEPAEEPIDLPPPPEVPPAESAWERGLRHAKEQMKKASQRKEQESNFEEKRLNLSVDEEREMNKENERRMVVHVPIVKDPYYDQAAFDEEEYYKQRGMNPWQSGRYENFEVRYNREEYSPYPRGQKEYYPPPPGERYPRHLSPVDKFGRHPRNEQRPEAPYRPNRVEEMRALSPSPPVPTATSPPPYTARRPADEWHDPWRRTAKNNRSKSPKGSRRGRSRSRSRRGRRSLSDSSLSSDSRSGSRSSGSHSSRSRSYSSGSSRSRSRSSEPAPPGVEQREQQRERNFGPPHGRFMDGGPRSAVSVRGRHDRGGHHHWRGGGDRGGGDFNRRGRGHFYRGGHHPGHHPYPERHHRGQAGGPGKPMERGFPPGYGYNRPPPGQGRPPERRIPPDALRPKKALRSASSSGSSRSRSRSHSGSRSGSSSSFSRSRSGSAGSHSVGSRSRSHSASSVSSHTSSSSSSSSGSADSDNLYRDLGEPTVKKKTAGPRGDRKHPPGNNHPHPPLPRDRRMGGGVPNIPLPNSAHPHAPSRGPRGSDLRPDGRLDRPDGRLDRIPPPPAPEGRQKVPEGRPGREGPPGRDGERGGGGMEPPTRGGRPDRAERAERVERADRPNKGERLERTTERPERQPRPERAERAERGMERAENRAERAERGERGERERPLGVSKAVREQSSRPPPSMQPKAKDPMKLIGLKSNIKLSLVSKQPGDKSGAGLMSSPLKRRPLDAGEAPPAKRPALPTSPVKMPSEKAVKPMTGRERARSPGERQPRSATAGSLPSSMAAAIPLPPSPTKASSSSTSSSASKPRQPPPSSKPPHPAPSSKASGASSAAPSMAPPSSAGPPSSTPAGAPGASASAAKAKKSTTSRREELLKQLKAVEDAIARKKAKMQ